MTTATWKAHVGPRARALNAIKMMHCDAQGRGPANPAKGLISCPKCSKPLKFTVLAVSGRTTGQCATAGCLTWKE